MQWTGSSFRLEWRSPGNCSSIKDLQEDVPILVLVHSARGLKKSSSPGYSRASEIAVIYVSLGNSDQAMSWLERSYEERFNPGALLRPGFDPLRSDPRFQDLLRRIGLPR